jgi:hypothetical protein
MSHPLATYSFLPWLRQGLANNLAQNDMDVTVKTRAAINVQLTLKAQGVAGAVPDAPVSKAVQLYGPGDIVGIDRKAIVKHEPRDWITNFEANYLPYIEFYDEDFPWRYTPARPNGHRLRPWIMLVALKENEFSEGKNVKGKPLPFIEVGNAGELFPPADQLWAWAHVHVNRSLGANESEVVSNDGEAVAARFQDALGQNPDLAYSRVLCPRQLEAKQAYHAFLIPVFETGRLAGLGLDIEAAPHATFSAWASYEGKVGAAQFPYYFRWTFQTGEVGDFEYLVRLLKPQPIDTRVGVRDMDVRAPGSNLSGIEQAELGGILKLGGALRIPRSTMNPEELETFDMYDQWAQPFPQPFQLDLAAFINLDDDYAAMSAEDAHGQAHLPEDLTDYDDENPDQDPLITPPLYGRWHALSNRLLVKRDGAPVEGSQFTNAEGKLVSNWLHELNVDPRFRVAAGFGTDVVKDQQEAYMKIAWEQVGDVLEANRRMRLAQMAKAVSLVWHNKYLLPMRAAFAEKTYALTTPMQKRILTDGFTVHYHFFVSPVPNAVLSAPMRRIVRPGGRLMRALPWGDTPESSPNTLLQRLNEGAIRVAPPKTAPPGATTEEDVADTLQPANTPGWLAEWLRKYPWLKFIPLILALIILLLLFLFSPPGNLWPPGVALVLLLIALFRFLHQRERALRGIDAVLPENRTPESVDALPKSPDFRLTRPGDSFRPSGGNTDSAEAARFKVALKETNAMVAAAAAAAEKAPRRPLNLAAIIDATIQGLRPDITIPRRYFQQVRLPEHIRRQQVETFTEAWAYPRIDLPMYKPLVELSDELFLPNINFVAPNSISLLETNQKFIESYMVGLNHEFARELLWREYPTDQRGSYFRQFWDPSSVLNTENLDEETLRERLYDIPKLHLWSKFSELGDHDHREQGGDKEEEVVLVIRGELLKRYPTAVIYAQKAAWTLKADGTIDKTVPRQPVALSPAQEDNPPRELLRTPLYEAKVDPDIYFFGFDLTAEEAQGARGDEPDAKDRPGWFFVIRERPGEPRFGLDIDRPASEPLNTWNDLAWSDALVENDYLQIKPGMPAKTLSAPSGAQVNELEQHQEDTQIPWNANTNAADLAYILYQVPVLVAVHGAEMLPKS